MTFLWISQVKLSLLTGNIDFSDHCEPQHIRVNFSDHKQIYMASQLKSSAVRQPNFHLT